MIACRENVRTIQDAIITHPYVLPTVKAKLGIILFKLENNMGLECSEEVLLNEIIRFVGLSK